MSKKLDINVAKSFFENNEEKISDLKNKTIIPVLNKCSINDNSNKIIENKNDEPIKKETKNNKQSKALVNKGYYITDDLYKRLLLTYAETRIDMSKIVRAALNEYLNNHSYENIIKLLKNNKEI